MIRGSFWIGGDFFSSLEPFITDGNGGENEGMAEMISGSDLYESQKIFFREAYRSNRIGWPRTGASFLVRAALDQGFLSSGARVLEIGCGEGRNLQALRLGGCSVVGMDYLSEPLRTAKATETNQVPLVQGDLFAVPFRENVFDSILDWGVFHHLKKSERAQYPKWISRLVVPGGLMLLGAFSEQFRHHPGESRRQMFVRHRGHYDVFFDPDSFSRAMGPDWTLLWRGEEDQGDGLSHYRLGIFRHAPLK